MWVEAVAEIGEVMKRLKRKLEELETLHKNHGARLAGACHFADALSTSLLIHLLGVEGVAAE